MTSDTTILEAQNVSLSFGATKAINDVSFDIKEGEIRAIIGPNGAGKTSMLNCISGFYRPQIGSVLFYDDDHVEHDLTTTQPRRIAGLGIARTFQNLALYTGLSTVDNLMAARHIHMQQNMVDSLLFWGRAKQEEIKHRETVEEIIDFLEINAIRKSIVGSLPYGLRKRIELGRALALEPKILLLDEPMAGMNSEEKEDIARFILDVHERRGVTIVLIEHDIGAVMDLSDRVVVMDFGRKIGDGTPEKVSNNPEVIQAYLGEEG